jgi:hypothetical protein
VIDIQTEPLIPLADACRLIPPGRGGRRTHLSTILRWILNGSKAPGGRTVKLEALRLGGKWVTSREAIQRFALALTPALDGTATVPAPRTTAGRKRASDRAAAELEQMGI